MLRPLGRGDISFRGRTHIPSVHAEGLRTASNGRRSRLLAGNLDRRIFPKLEITISEGVLPDLFYVMRADQRGVKDSRVCRSSLA